MKIATIRATVFLMCISLFVAMSCKKNKTTTTPTPTPVDTVHIDTFAALTSNTWVVRQIWYDKNANNKQDSGEVSDQRFAHRELTFKADGTTLDTMYVGGSRGTWKFINQYKSEFNQYYGIADTTYNKIVGISDSSLALSTYSITFKTSPGTYYFVKL